MMSAYGRARGIPLFMSSMAEQLFKFAAITARRAMQSLLTSLTISRQDEVVRRLAHPSLGRG
jgi:hypothetical protein